MIGPREWRIDPKAAEIDDLRRELAQQAAFEAQRRAILEAWIVAGPRPDIHRAAQDRLRRDWPVLAAALDAAARAEHLPSPTAAPAPTPAAECTCAMTEASQRTCPLHGEDDWRSRGRP